MSSYYPFDLYQSTGIEFKYEPKKKTIPNRKIKKELQNNLASKKMTVTPLLQTIMKGVFVVNATSVPDASSKSVSIIITLVLCPACFSHAASCASDHLRICIDSF